MYLLHGSVIVRGGYVGEWIVLWLLLLSCGRYWCASIHYRELIIRLQSRLNHLEIAFFSLPLYSIFIFV